jgi:hypothetical protein
VPLADPFRAPNASKWDGMTVESFKDSYLWSKGSKMFADLFVRSVFGTEARDISFLYFLHYSNSAGVRSIFPRVLTVSRWSFKVGRNCKWRTRNQNRWGLQPSYVESIQMYNKLCSFSSS